MSNSIIDAAMARFFNVSHIWSYAQDVHYNKGIPKISYPNVVTRTYDAVESWSFAFKGFPLYAGKTVTGSAGRSGNRFV